MKYNDDGMVETYNQLNVLISETNEGARGIEVAEEFKTIAMKSRYNFELALMIKEAWNKAHPNFGTGRPYFKPHLGYTLPWIADKHIKFLRLVKRCAPDMGTWEGGCSWHAVYNVHGVEKECTDWDKVTKMPLPCGVASEGLFADCDKE